MWCWPWLQQQIEMHVGRSYSDVIHATAHARPAPVYTRSSSMCDNARESAGGAEGLDREEGGVASWATATAAAAAAAGHPHTTEATLISTSAHTRANQMHMHHRTCM